MSARSRATMLPLLAEWARRLLRARGWIILQLLGVALLLLVALGWTRIPEKNAWQVMLSLVIPALLVAAFLLLQSGTMRSLLKSNSQEQDFAVQYISIAWGAATLLLWIAVAIVAWDLLDRFDDRIDLWAGYLNSRFGADMRARIATEQHIAWFLNYAERAFRWVILPGLLIPLCSSAAWGLRRLPWKRVLRVWLSWRWWPMVLAAALIGVAWPSTFFAALPHGSVSAQVWTVVLKLIAAYLLSIAAWIALLAWAATLLRCGESTHGDGDDDSGDLAGVGVRVRPPDGGKSASVRLPLPDSGDDSGGNA
ncbi:MAG: hypothetical protein WBE76_28075 [Terracidiphilus sp.]